VDWNIDCLHAIKAIVDHATDQEQALMARARLGDDHAVGLLLSLRYNLVATAIALQAAVGCYSSQLSVTNLRGLSFLRDMILPEQGSVSCSEIRSLARAEMKTRGEWKMRDRLHAIANRVGGTLKGPPIGR
jgi:hypothetical protein